MNECNISGADGCSSFTKYRNKRKWRPPMSLHKPSMYASTAAVIQLVALMPDNSTVLLFENEAVNSAFGVIPLRLDIFFFDNLNLTLFLKK